jgi:serine/threonine protein kinase
MHYAFQDLENLYIVLDYVSCGDLRYHMGRGRTFSERKISSIRSYEEFFAACLILGLEYIHSMGVIHRDLKPENIVMDFQGYLKITDFGIARYMRSDNSSETSGTAGYISPEVLCQQTHGPTADVFALGVICYELLLGNRPYDGLSRKEMRTQVLSKQVRIEPKDIDSSKMSSEGVQFINKCLERKPSLRLGFEKGTQSLKEHPWFKDFPWDELQNRIVQSPYRPTYYERDIDYGERQISDLNLITNHAIVYPTEDPFSNFNYKPVLFSTAAIGKNRLSSNRRATDSIAPRESLKLEINLPLIHRR